MQSALLSRRGYDPSHIHHSEAGYQVLRDRRLLPIGYLYRGSRCCKHVLSSPLSPIAPGGRKLHRHSNGDLLQQVSGRCTSALPELDPQYRSQHDLVGRTGLDYAASRALIWETTYVTSLSLQSAFTLMNPISASMCEK